MVFSICLATALVHFRRVELLTNETVASWNIVSEKNQIKKSLNCPVAFDILNNFVHTYFKQKRKYSSNHSWS